MQSMSAYRGLVVDGDPSERRRLASLLETRCVVTDRATGAEEAAHFLRRNEYDVALIAVVLPTHSAELLMSLIDRGTLLRPSSVALTGTREKLASIEGRLWTARTTLVPSPVCDADAHAFLDAAFAPDHARTAAARTVLLAGSGAWFDDLARLLELRDARVVRSPGAMDAVRLFRAERPAAVVVGPPLSPSDLMLVTSMVRTSVQHTASVIAVAEPTFAPELASVGADRTIALTGGLASLADDVMKAAGVPRRLHRRAPLASPIQLSTGARALTFDIAEGGLGVAGLRRPERNSVDVRFRLPGADQPILARSEVAWSAPGRNPRFGLRFTAIPPRALSRIRAYISTQ